MSVRSANSSTSSGPLAGTDVHSGKILGINRVGQPTQSAPFSWIGGASGKPEATLVGRSPGACATCASVPRTNHCVTGAPSTWTVCSSRREPRAVGGKGGQ
jgi:hypothetical protein